MSGARAKHRWAALAILAAGLVSCASLGEGRRQGQSAGAQETKCAEREFPRIRGRAFHYFPESECERARESECTVRGMGKCTK